MDNTPTKEDEISFQNSNIKKQFTTVTPLSKYLAMALFVILPFVGFYLGRMSISLEVDVTSIQTNEVTEAVKTVPTDDQITGVVMQSATTSTNDIKLSFSQEDIKVGTVVRMAGNLIPGPHNLSSDSMVHDYTVTSVRQINILDKNVNHLIFEACYYDTCEVFVFNNKGQLFSPFYPRSEWIESNENIDKQYQELIVRKTKEDILNNEDKTNEFFIRTLDYPYLYQTVSCADSTAVSSCSLKGLNIDIDQESTTSTVDLASKGNYIISSSELSGNLEDPTEYIKYARRNINGQFLEVSLGVRIENLQAEEKLVTVTLVNKNKVVENSTLLEISVPVKEETELIYDFRNQSNEVFISIGERRLIFNFTDGTLSE